MSYEVKIIADSRGPNGARVTTFQLRYPRMVHAELMTHRAFSRNASSTRAIPTSKMIEWIERDPAMPVYWGKNQKGMQATEELPVDVVKECESAWLAARDQMIAIANGLMDAGVHKQIASRILEPWAHINVVVTATSYANFFALRCDKNAMPEIQKLAVMMARAYRDSVPVLRGPAQSDLDDSPWHLPYVTDDERLDFENVDLLKLSVARCARVSYLTFEGKRPNAESDIKLHDTLLGNGHWSPFEHPAKSHPAGYGDGYRSGNFVGWTQYRQTLPRGVHDAFDFGKLAAFDDRGFIV